MIELKATFGTVNFDDWLNRLKKDLRSDDLRELQFNDEIEDLIYVSYNSASNSPKQTIQPGDFPYTRNFNRPLNEWKNAARISADNDKSVNSKALDVLMKGADALIFELKKESNLPELLNGIGLEYIHSLFMVSDTDQAIDVLKGPVKVSPETVSIGLDPLIHSDAFKPELLDNLKNVQIPVYLADGFRVQQCGANITQELAFMLSTANECLYHLVNNGLTADQASACIHFRVGIGSNYFMEIAKFRALRTLWSEVVKAYNPVHSCSYNCRITATTGNMNKSAKDPHTNLLRQTTEALSALLGGAEVLHIEAHDSYTSKGPSALAERMAMNISLILKEESYMDKVIDALGGSYTVEALTANISQKAWSLFQQLDSSGGILEQKALEPFLDQVRQKGQQRLETYRTGKRTLIGVNKFPNPKTEENAFLPVGQYLGIPEIIFERDI
ncbi:MAG: methylmalonyl-CoA mutase family protein [Bacteroidota bacterium]|jgi:methylmalonyl-CoA mutase